MRDIEKREEESFIYDPIDKWWEYFFLWGAYQGKVKVYKYKDDNETPQNKKSWMTIVAISLTTVLGKVTADFLRKNVQYKISMPISTLEVVIISYFIIVFSTVIMRKMLFKRKKSREKLDYCGTVDFNLIRIREVVRMSSGIAVNSFLYIGLTVGFVTSKLVYVLVLYLIILLLLIPYYTFNVGTMLKIPERIKEGELEVID